MTGTFYHSMDDKGRLFIPARLRDELGDVFHVTRSLENCLTAYSDEMWEIAINKLKTMPQAAQVQLRPLFSQAHKCEPDSQGRIKLPQYLRDAVGLKRNVTVVGIGLYVQLWDSDTYKPIEEQETAAPNIADVIREHGF